MKKLEFLNPSLFNIRTNINGYLDEENSLVQISGFYTNNDWINIGFYIKANNVSTTTENGNTITYLVYDLMTKKYSFTNSLDKLNIYKLYFKLYVNNNKFYASTDSIIPVNITATTNTTTTNNSNTVLYSQTANVSKTSLYSMSSDISNVSYSALNANYSLTSEFSNIANKSLTSNISLTSLYSLISDTSNYAINSNSANISKTALYSLSSDISNTSYNSLTSLYSLSSGTSNYSISSLTAQYSLSSYYSYTAEYAKYVLTSVASSANAISSIFDIPYTRIFVGASFPTNALDYDSYYDFYAKKLYVYVSGNWQEINWKEYVKSDRLYKEGKLRINNSTNGLEIMTSNTTWYEIVPTIGAVFTPISYAGYIYYIAPGQTFNGFSSSVAPIIAVNNTQYRGVYFHTYPGEAWFGIFPSGLTISGGYSIYNGQAAATSGRNFVPILEQAYAYANWADISIQIIKDMMRITGLGQGYAGNYAEVTIGFGSFPTNGYYLGIWCYEGKPITVDMVSIKREA